MMYGFDAEEARRRLAWKPTPFWRVSEGCKGLTLSGGLYLQCGAETTEELCKKCSKKNYGLATERLEQGAEWTAPNGKKPKEFMKVIGKSGFTVDEIVEEMCWKLKVSRDEIPMELFETKKTTRGRPKKEKKEGCGDVIPAKKPRGRPKKEKKVLSDTEGDLIESLIVQARTASDAAPVRVGSDVGASVEEVAVVEGCGDNVAADTGCGGEAPADTGCGGNAPAKKGRGRPKKEKKVAAAVEGCGGNAPAVEGCGGEAPAKKGRGRPKKEKKVAVVEDDVETEEAVAEEVAVAEEEAVEIAAVEGCGDNVPAVEGCGRGSCSPATKEADEIPAEGGVEVSKVMIDGVEYLKDDDDVLYDVSTQEAIGMWDGKRIVECEFE